MVLEFRNLDHPHCQFCGRSHWFYHIIHRAAISKPENVDPQGCSQLGRQSKVRIVPCDSVIQWFPAQMLENPNENGDPVDHDVMHFSVLEVPVEFVGQRGQQFHLFG